MHACIDVVASREKNEKKNKTEQKLGTKNQRERVGKKERFACL